MPPDYVSFCEETERYLRDHASSVAADMARELPPGKWHPNGFAVFHLGAVGDMGSLRFHVWPRRLRRERPGHPRIHSHPWHLASLILAGEYNEVIYLVDAEADETAPRWSEYTARYDPARSPMIIETDRTRPASGDSSLRCGPGEMHFVPAGTFHSTPIEDDEFAVTLVITSEDLLPTPTMLGEGGAGSSTYQRPAVSGEDLAVVQAQVRDGLAA